MTESNEGGASGRPRRPARPCPICGKPATEAYKPFCSQRCADVDLHRWLSESYVVPVTEDEEAEREPDESGETSPREGDTRH